MGDVILSSRSFSFGTVVWRREVGDSKFQNKFPLMGNDRRIISSVLSSFSDFITFVYVSWLIMWPLCLQSGRHTDFTQDSRHKLQNNMKQRVVMLEFEPRFNFESHALYTALHLKNLYWLPLSLIHSYMQPVFTGHQLFAKQSIRSIFSRFA